MTCRKAQGHSLPSFVFHPHTLGWRKMCQGSQKSRLASSGDASLLCPKEPGKASTSALSKEWPHSRDRSLATRHCPSGRSPAPGPGH